MRNSLKFTGKQGTCALMAALLLSGCETVGKKKAEPVVYTEPEVVIYVPEVVEPAPQPVAPRTISDAEWRWMQLERDRAAREAAGEIVESAAIVVDTPPVPAEPAAPTKTVLELAAEAATPDEKIGLLNSAPDSGQKSSMLLAAYRSKLAADKASGNKAGAAEALVYLAKVDAAKGTQAANLTALKKYAEAQSLDANNAAAPQGVSSLRSKLQPYADSLHKEAAALFVKQDFAPAVERWDTVLLIDPGNTAARNWYKQATEAIGR